MSARPPVLLWFRKDLRLDDNRALMAALGEDAPLICIYIREPAPAGPLGAAQQWWLHHSLAALARGIAARGNRLLLLSGPAEHALQRVCAETGASLVFVNRGCERNEADRAIALALKPLGIRMRAFDGQLLAPARSITTGAGKAFRVFTPFWNAMQKAGEPEEPLEAPAILPPPPHSIALAGERLDDWGLLPRDPDWACHFSEIWQPGEDGAQAKLEEFREAALQGYRLQRDFPAIAGTSLMSPHLALGEISPARLWHGLRAPAEALADLAHFRRELAWRDFCYNMHVDFPQLATENWNARFDGFSWRQDEAGFKAWTRGMTGYPIVDAGMRQLWRHGFMHNRVRMVTASFLIKHLLIDWRLGEQWFRDTLVDADPANNPGNWQWVAGSGADASPFFRIFNPVLQGEKFDPDGDYVRSFVPELARMPAKYIHRPFDAPPAVLRDAGIRLGETYPHPVVEHGFARQRALSALKRLDAPAP